MTDMGFLLLQSLVLLNFTHNLWILIFSSPLPQDHIIRFGWLGDTYTSDGWWMFYIEKLNETLPPRPPHTYTHTPHKHTLFHAPSHQIHSQLWCSSYHLLSKKQDNLRANDKLWQMACLQAPARRWSWQTPSPFLFLQALGCARQHKWYTIGHGWV